MHWNNGHCSFVAMMVKLLLYCWFCSCETYGKVNAWLVESELGLLDNKISSVVRS